MMVHTLDDGSTNKLVQELGAPHMEMLLDLLVHPEGPRLRDHISHGEVGASDDITSHDPHYRLMFSSYLISWLVM